MKMNCETVIKNIFKIVLIAVFFGAFAYLCYLPFKRADDERKEITGIVKDKWIDIIESQQGAGFSLKLLVETVDGKRITIKVNRKAHSEAEIGSIIKRDKQGEIEIEK